MRIHILAAACAAMACSVSVAHAGSCVKAGGEATMITEDLAKFMANAALNNQIKANSWAPSGKVSMTCSPATFGVHCVAHQRACKA
jgi:hypothetical protein